MRFLTMVVALCAVMLGTVPSTASAQAARTAPSFWNDAYGPKSANDRQVDLNIAEAQLRARNNGYGPAQSITNIGTANSTSNFNGPVTTTGSSATNVVNSNSTYANANGNGIQLSVSTGQSAGPTNQGAASQTTVGNGNTPTTTGTGGPR